MDRLDLGCRVIVAHLILFFFWRAPYVRSTLFAI